MGSVGLMGAAPGVGTLGEKPLHAAVKRWYAAPGDLVEQPVDGFVIDLVRGDQLIEIQTRGFSSMRRKLDVLLEQHPVTVVHPIAAQKWIVKVDQNGEVLSRRRSPRRGTSTDVFAELVSLPDLVHHPGFTLELLLVNEEEVRRHDERRAWRRKGWVIAERRLVDIVDRVVIATAQDLGALLPDDLPPRFTTADLARALGRPRRLAQQMAYCLRRAGVIDVVGKTGNTVVYVRADDSSPEQRG